MHKLLLLTLDYPPNVGGVARFLSHLYQTLSSHPSFNIQVLTDKTKNQEEPGAIFRKTLISPSRFIWPKWLPALYHTWRYVKKNQRELLLVSQVLPLGTVAYIIKKIYDIPYFVFVYGPDITFAQTSPRKKWLLRKILSSAEWVIANSDYTRSEAMKAGVAKAKIIVVYPGASPLPARVSDERKQAIIEKYNLASRKIILTVGRLERRKGHDMVIHSLPIVTKKIPNLIYIIIGRGSQRERLADMASEQRISDHVLFLDFVKDEELLIFYALCDMFIMVSREIDEGHGRDFEGFGMVFLDANSLGKPVIGGRSAGVPEAIHDGVSGLLVDPNDPSDIANKITQLLVDPVLARKLGEQGRARAQSLFQWDKLLKPLVTLLDGYAPPLVSVIIPCYQAATTLERSLASIFDQTYKNLEIITVNDGSTDRTLEMLGGYANRVKIIDQPNRGASAARNRGFQETKGDYVMFCDADVILKPAAIEKMVKVLETHPEATYCYSNFRFGWHTFSLFEFDEERLKRENYISTMSLVRRAHFPGFDENLKRLQDWDLWLTMLAKGYKGIWYPEYLFSAPVKFTGISKLAGKPPPEAVAIIKKKHHL